MYDENRFYFASDPKVLALACYSTMAHWRCEGRGPSFFKFGNRVAYSGSDLNAWLDRQRVETAAA